MTNKEVQKELTFFFLITFLVTWLLWLPSVLSAMNIEVPIFLLIIAMTASFTPSIVGLILHRKYLGINEFKVDMKSRLSFGFPKKWLILLPLFFISIAGISYGLTNLFVTDFEATNTIPLFMTPLVFLQILFVGGALGEEFGWRGFAYPRLTKVMPTQKATFVLGIIWSIWHLPLFFMIGTVQSSMPIWQFMIQNTLIAFFYTWLYHKTKGNLWLMIYLHAIANTSSAIFPYWQSNTGRLLGFGVLLIAYVLLLSLSQLSDKSSK